MDIVKRDILLEDALNDAERFWNYIDGNFGATIAEELWPDSGKLKENHYYVKYGQTSFDPETFYKRLDRNNKRILRYWYLKSK